MNAIALDGCRPEPLMHYLKALGVLRLISLQKDSSARACWKNGRWVLFTRLDQDQIVDFFLKEYAPTPITSPWNGGSGYYPKDPVQILDTIRQSTADRFAAYREVLNQIPRIMESLGLQEKPTEGKQEFLKELRRRMPDSFLAWLDAAVVMLADKCAFPPLLGTGGNDGRLDFSINFMKRLISLGLPQDQPGKKTEDFLANSLFGVPTTGLTKDAVGQFNPGKAGGPNSTQGMEGDAADNPWDFVLMMEGAVAFTGSASRRLASEGSSIARFPFTVDTVAAEATVEAKDSREAKGELWLPLWSAPATLAEIQSLLNEGRAEIGERAAKSGVDFARAIASLGVDRGIDAFSRSGFLIRNGLSVFVTPLGQFPVKAQEGVDLLRELDAWLMTLRILSRDEKTPNRFPAALRRIDAATLAFCRQGGPARMGDLLAALGSAFGALASSPKNREKFRGLPRLSKNWWGSIDDGSPEYRLARSLAGVYDPNNDPEAGPLSVNVLPLEAHRFQVTWAAGPTLDCVWTSGPLAENLAQILKRRLMVAQRSSNSRLPLESMFEPSLDDIIEFLDGRTDDRRIEDLLFGMLAIQPERAQTPSKPEAFEEVPLCFTLVRPMFCSEAWRFRGVNIPSEPQMPIFSALLAKDSGRAFKLAADRLRHWGLTPVGSRRVGRHSPFDGIRGINPIRLAASLLFPLSEGAVSGLLTKVCRSSAVTSEAL